MEGTGGNRDVYRECIGFTGACTGSVHRLQECVQGVLRLLRGHVKEE